MPRKKHFLIGSANPVNRGFLAQIKNERRAIDTALNKKPELVHLISKPDLSFEELVDGFMDNEEIEFFHYCGHSSEIGVTLEASPTQGETVTKERFCNFLSSQKNLKIAFLNSCTSTSIGQELIKRGTVEVVIETVKPIYDEAAALFAKLFYGYLIKGESIKEAFNQSISVLEDPTKEKQENKRGDGFDDDTGSSTFPWRLYPSIADEQHLVNSWRLFTSIEGTLKTHKGPNLLCVYPPYKEYSRYFNGYFDDVKAVLNSPDFIDSKDEKDSIFVCDFESVRAENASLIERFDCLLFFVNAKFNEFWSTEKEYFRGSLGKLKVGY
ncbi:MAG: CHAT domain-containing protein [Cyanobacteria bacterium J06649_11]